MKIKGGKIPEKMAAVFLTGHGGVEKLEYREDIPTPSPGADEVLIKVLATGVNNTDINTRIGWYSGEAGGSTAEFLQSGIGVAAGGWSGELSFPRIQGADVCGQIIALGSNVPDDRIGQRVVVQSCLVSQRAGDFVPWLGSERDGGFAQYVCAPNADTHAVGGPLSHAELAALPCGYGTAANLLVRAKVSDGDRVLITGASGNVGLAAIQLARAWGGQVVAIASPEKHAVLRDLGASECFDRDAFLPATLGRDSMDVVIDVVGGPQWPQLLEVLKPGGRYAVSGAIAGPMVSLDLRKLYLKDLTLLGCTTQSRESFMRMLGLAVDGTLRPPVAETLPLHDIAKAQELFLSKRHVGKIVLLPHG